MPDYEKSNVQHVPSRRAFVKISTTAAAVGWLAARDSKVSETKPVEPAVPQEPPVVALTREARDQMTPDQILAKWKEGNLRFREGRKIQRDFLAEAKATASGQFPAGVLLSCIDSRAPAEILFNLGMGDVFNARIAGNIENPDILGSMEFTTWLPLGAGAVFGASRKSRNLSSCPVFAASKKPWSSGAGCRTN